MNPGFSFLSQVMAVWRVELLRLQRTLIWSGVFLSFFMALAVLNGVSFSVHQQQNVDGLTQQSEAWQNKQAQKTKLRELQLRSTQKPLQPDKKIYRNPAYLANTGPYVSYPLAASAFLSVGQSPLLPQSHRVTLMPSLLWEPVYNIFHPMQLWLGYFDVTFVFSYLFPLFVILISLDLLADERLNGNLSLYATYQWSWQKLLAAKLMLRWLLIALFLVGLSCEVLGLAAFLGHPLPLSMLWVGFCFNAGQALFWLGLAACCHRWQKQPALIGLGLTACWLSFAWVVPAMVGQWVSAYHPVPSRFTYLQHYRETEESVRKQQDRETATYLQDHPEMQGGADNTYAVKQLAKAKRFSEALTPLAMAYQAQLNTQLKWVNTVRFVSPIYGVQESLQRLYGSNRQRYMAYTLQMEQFQNEWLHFFQPKIQQGIALSSADFRAFPSFVFQEPSFASRVASAFAPPLFWGGLGVLLIGLSLGLTQRLD